MHSFIVISLTLGFELLRELFLLLARLTGLKEEAVPGGRANFGLELVELFVGGESQVVLAVGIDGSKERCYDVRDRERSRQGGD